MIPLDVLFLNNIFPKEFPLTPGSVNVLSQSYNNNRIRISRMCTYIIFRQIHIFYFPPPGVFCKYFLNSTGDSDIQKI